MNSKIMLSLLIATQSFFAFSASADVITKEVVISVHDVFVPEKVEHNTDAKVILSGMFPNSCYRWSRAKVHDVDALNHNVQAIATVTETMCLMVLVPFTKEVNLGRLPAGTHKLRFINGDDTFFEKSLTVE